MFLSIWENGLVLFQLAVYFQRVDSQAPGLWMQTPTSSLRCGRTPCTLGNHTDVADDNYFTVVKEERNEIVRGGSQNTVIGTKAALEGSYF